MGQELLNPPTVEGWHTGKEWIDGGTLTERINFSVGEVSDPNKPGVEQIISRLKANGSPLSPDEFVDRCLELVGPLDVGDTTRESLTRFAASQGDLNIGADDAAEENNARVVRMLQLIVSSREYQFGLITDEVGLADFNLCNRRSDFIRCGVIYPAGKE